MEVCKECTAKVGYKKFYINFMSENEQYTWNERTDVLKQVRTEEYEDQVAEQ